MATLASSRVTWPLKPGSTKPAVACVSRPRRPSDDLPSTRAARSSGRRDHLEGRPEHELTGVQDERLVALGLDHPGQVRLVGGGVDVRVAVVLEDPEVAVEPEVDARGLDHRLVVGLHGDPLRLDLGQDVAVGEQHADNLPRSACGGPGSHNGLHAREPLRRDRRLLHRGCRRSGPRPAQRAARLGRPGGRGARRGTTRRLRLRQPRDPRAQAPPDPGRAARARAGPRARPGQRRTPAPTTSSGPGSTSTPSPRRTTTRSVGSRTPVPPSCCSPPSTRAVRRSTGRCAAGSRSTTRSCARSPTGTATLLVDFWRMREYRRLRRLGHRPDAPRPGRAPAHGDRGARRPRCADTTWRELPPTPHPQLTGRERLRPAPRVDAHPRRPVGPPAAHRPLVRRQHLAEATHAGPGPLDAAGRVTSPASVRTTGRTRM